MKESEKDVIFQVIRNLISKEDADISESADGVFSVSNL